MADCEPAITALHREYQHFAEQPMSTLTPLQRRDVDFYLADIDHQPRVDAFVRRWVDKIHNLDAFVAENDHLPRSDSTRPRPRTVEQQLVDWLAYQRRDGVRAAMSDYQRRRLETVPGYRWSPLGDVWLDTFRRHQQFWRDRGHAPRRRSADKDEVTLGRWVAHQRASQRAGQLLPERERILRTASHRVI